MSNATVSPRTRDERWIERATALCIHTVRSLGPAYARRLRRQRMPFDALRELLVLSARRAVRLPESRRRGLPRHEAPALARAFSALMAVDRSALQSAFRVADPNSPQAWAQAQVSEQAGWDHTAAALQRLLRNARSARRHGGDAPIGVAHGALRAPHD